MRYFPINVDIQGKECVVIGGGNVARRKVTSLLNAGAMVRIVSPEIDEGIRSLASEKSINLTERKYRKGDLKGAALAFVAVDNPEVGEEAAREAKSLNIPINVADIPSQCTFTIPSVAERGDLMITVSTGGRCPAFSRAVRLKIEELIDDAYGIELELLGETREKLLEAGIGYDNCRDSLNKLIDSDILLHIRNGDMKKAKAVAEEELDKATATKQPFQREENR